MAKRKKVVVSDEQILINIKESLEYCNEKLPKMIKLNNHQQVCNLKCLIFKLEAHRNKINKKDKK